MKRTFGSLLCIIVILTLAVSCGSAEQTLSVAKMLDLGEKHLLEMNYEQALVQFLSVIEIEPMNTHGYLGAAEAYVGLGDVDAAIAILWEGYDLTSDEQLRTRLEELETSGASGAEDAVSEEELAEETADESLRWPNGMIMPQELTVLVWQEVERYFEPDGMAFPPGTGFSCSYEYDQHGFLTRAEATWTGYLDENGNQTSQRFSADGRIGSEVTVDSWVYDEETGRRTGLRDGEPDNPQVMDIEDPGTRPSSNMINICSDPFAEDRRLEYRLLLGEPMPDGRPERIENTEDWKREADWDYALVEYDEFNRTVKIDSYRNDGGLYGTARLEWAVLVLSPDGTYTMR